MKENFSKSVQLIIKQSKEEATRLGHSYIGSEHLLLGILRYDSGLTKKILDIFDINPNEMVVLVEDMIKSSGSTMTLGHLPLTRRAERILKNAYSEAISRGASKADDEHLLLAMLKETDGVTYEILKSFSLDFDTVSDLIDNEENSLTGLGIDNKKAKKSPTPTLDHFSRDITYYAIKGKLDPVIGRELEIERVAQILARRKKNNPVLIGDPGVGKTAIIEGLAQRIVNKTLPRILHNKRILSLDLSAIVAGTKYRGQFEERLKSVMAELEINNNVIVFIDEIHTLVGAGGSSGSLDASNMFKPSLARGDIHCIGATTFDEYRKSIEKDGALDRRLQKVMINEPSLEESIDILNGLKEKYEEYHKIKYTPEAINSCVYLSDRYITDKHLPDKAIDVMDEAGARAHMYNLEVPQSILDTEIKLQNIREQKELKVSEQLFEEAAGLRDREKKLQKILLKNQQDWDEQDNRITTEINSENIADVVSVITGVPLSKIAQSESNRLLNLSQEISRKIIGQDRAIDSIAHAIRRSRTGLKNPNKPIGVFLFLGPTGVGKTELAKCLANYLFPNNNNALIKVDMSEFTERFSLSRLIGAPPGYVGYEEGGELTEKIRRNPYSLVLLDEIEKCHPDLFNILLQVFDEGDLTDGLGRKVDFKNTIIIMTSNMGTKEFENYNFGFGNNKSNLDIQNMEKKIMDSVRKVFLPELINRIDESIVFNSLTESNVYDIIDLQIIDLMDNLQKVDIKLQLYKSAKVYLAKKGYNPKYGARFLRRTIQNDLENPISEMLLKYNIDRGSKISVRMIKNKLVFDYKISKNVRSRITKKNKISVKKDNK